jgi:hypothetical protein
MGVLSAVLSSTFFLCCFFARLCFLPLAFLAGFTVSVEAEFVVVFTAGGGTCAKLSVPARQNIITKTNIFFIAAPLIASLKFLFLDFFMG